MKDAAMEFARFQGAMKPMQYVILAIVSYTFYLSFALFQAPPASVPDIGVWKDVGLGTAYIFVSVWIIRYFTTYIKDLHEAHRAEMAAKDKQIQDLTEKVLKISENAIEVQTKTNVTGERISKLLEHMNA